jgi:hypothetical protein
MPGGELQGVVCGSLNSIDACVGPIVLAFFITQLTARRRLGLALRLALRFQFH